VLEGLLDADKQLPSLQTPGINLDDISEKLQLDGIAAFAAAYDKVGAALEKKSDVIVGGGPGRHPLEPFLNAALMAGCPIRTRAVR
jgi:hypothetical protein